MTVTCTVLEDGDAMVVGVSGRLALTDVADLRLRLLKNLVEQPSALLVDLSGLSVQDPIALSVFTAVRRQAARWPGIPVLLFAPTADVRKLINAGSFRYLTVADNLADARRRADDRRLGLPILREELFPVSGARRHARNVATEACLRWDLEHLIAPASLIANELVSNVIEHASTIATLQLSLRPRYLTIATRDGSTAEPVPPHRGAGGPYGLRLVEASAHSWGWMPIDGGKVVWATLFRSR
jgi:anti-anti-sigma regulatory factor